MSTLASKNLFHPCSVLDSHELLSASRFDRRLSEYPYRLVKSLLCKGAGAVMGGNGDDLEQSVDLF